MNQVRALRVSHQRGTQMYAEGKLPEPERIDGIAVEAGHDRAVGRAEVVGDSTLRSKL